MRGIKVEAFLGLLPEVFAKGNLSVTDNENPFVTLREGSEGLKARPTRLGAVRMTAGHDGMPSFARWRR